MKVSAIEVLLAEDTKRSKRPPKEWWDKIYKEVKEDPNYKGYSKERLSQIVGGIWADYTEDQKKGIRNQYGKEYGKASSKNNAIKVSDIL